MAVDLLAPEGYGEISGGGIREDNLEKIKLRILESNLEPKDYQWYLDLRKYGSVPHGGFGLGIERILRWILGFEDIKDVVTLSKNDVENNAIGILTECMSIFLARQNKRGGMRKTKRYTIARIQYSLYTTKSAITLINATNT